MGHSSPERNPFDGRAVLWFPLDPRNLLDFALELRLAKSHRFADYNPNAETREERRGEERKAQTDGGEEAGPKS